MNEKIQLKLEIMKAWADLADYAERIKQDKENLVESAKKHMAEYIEENGENEDDWRIDSYKRDMNEYVRQTKAYDDVIAQIYKLMG